MGKISGVFDCAAGMRAELSPRAASGGVSLAWDGTLFNAGELAAQYRIAAADAPKLVLALYGKLGEAAFSLLNGAFACALADEKRRCGYLVRDHAGARPLAAFASGTALVFGSTPAQLTRRPEFRRKLDPDAVAFFLSYQYLPVRRGIYCGVFHVGAGELLKYDFASGSFSFRRWWRPDFSRKDHRISFDAAAQQLRTLIERAVQRQLGDGPAGVLLSGGVDSAVIAGTAGRLRAPEALSAFTIGVADPAYDERCAAAAMLRRINRHGGNLTAVELKSHPGALTELRRLVREYGEPYGDASLLPTWQLYQAAGRHVPLLLSGDGGDELFCGYDRYRALEFARLRDAIPGARALFALAAKCLPCGGERSFAGRARRLLAFLADSSAGRYLHVADRCPPDLRRRLYGERLLAAQAPERLFLADDPTAADVVERAAECDLANYLPCDTFLKTAIAAEAARVQVLAPLFDREVVEFAVSLPRRFKQQGRERKRVLKAAFPELFSGTPPGRKLGFGTPLAAYLRNEWRAEAEAALDSGTLERGGWVRPGSIRELWDEHLSQRADHGYLLWSLMHLTWFLTDLHQ